MVPPHPSSTWGCERRVSCWCPTRHSECGTQTSSFRCCITCPSRATCPIWRAGTAAWRRTKQWQETSLSKASDARRCSTNGARSRAISAACSDGTQNSLRSGEGPSERRAPHLNDYAGQDSCRRRAATRLSALKGGRHTLQCVACDSCICALTVTCVLILCALYILRDAPGRGARCAVAIRGPHRRMNLATRGPPSLHSPFRPAVSLMSRVEKLTCASRKVPHTKVEPASCVLKKRPRPVKPTDLRELRANARGC